MKRNIMAFLGLVLSFVFRGFLLFVGMSMQADERLHNTPPMKNSELRKLYYPDYVSKAEAQRDLKEEKENYNETMCRMAINAGAGEYVSWDGHLCNAKNYLHDNHPHIPAHGVIQKNVAPARKYNGHYSKIKIVK